MRWIFAFLLWASPAAAVECSDEVWNGISLSVCEVDTATEDLRLFHRGPDGVLGGFAAVEAAINAPLAFAMNAGMYHPDRAPVGLYQEDGQIQSPIVLREGPGNFGLLPNGVFCITDSDARVVESSLYRPELCRDATQSGPMLVIDGALHPRFIPNGTSRLIRNGVGTTEGGETAYFVISNEPVNFHDFARFFRDALQVPQALYFDGRVSRLYAPDLNRNDLGLQLGPIVAVVD